MKSPNLFSQTNIHTNGMPEVPAKFPGGIEALHAFIQQYLTYPFTALEAEIEGEVYVSFLITEAGELQAPEILESLHAECDQEALRLLAKMPKWTPAQNVGSIVPVQVKMPVQFKLANVPAEYE